MTKTYNIVFAGTPAFALPSLQACLDSHHNVCAVFTQPDKKAGRGQQRTPSPVKALAESHGIPVHTPPHFKEAAAVELAPGESGTFEGVASSMAFRCASLSRSRSLSERLVAISHDADAALSACA